MSARYVRLHPYQYRPHRFIYWRHQRPQWRLYEHRSGNGDASKFTGRYQTDLLVYFELWYDAAQAIAREKQLKGWTRARKDALVNTLNPDWTDIDLATWQG